MGRSEDVCREPFNPIQEIRFWPTRFIVLNVRECVQALIFGGQTRKHLFTQRQPEDFRS